MWDAIRAHQDLLTRTGELSSRRARQAVEWFWAMVRDGVLDRLRSDPDTRDLAAELTTAVRAGTVAPGLAADEVLSAFLDRH